ncbi:MAG: phosphate acyltransferase [Verrucomicrobiota bacterium JB022]|nr:phosphate acyltransferase [Verrucomicrobiota bacterium JB022]
MGLIDQLLGKLQRHPKRVVFPEGHDPRIIQTARQFVTRRCGVPVLLGDRAEIKERARRLDIRLDGIRILEPDRSEDFEIFRPMIDQHPKYAEATEDEKRSILLDRHNFAALMLENHRVDALVAGATMSASSGLRSLFRFIPTQKGVKSASSMLILDQENPNFGLNGLLFLADCGVIPEPTVEQLADIAVSTARIAHHLTNEEPRVAMLSFATHAQKIVHPSISKIREARDIARKRADALGLRCQIEGELQLDAALSPLVAGQKGLPDDPVAGRANVLVFPDLNSGNIASKMIQLVAGARTYGQLIIGLDKPCAEISRGAHAYDIFGTAVVAACQSIDRRLLYSNDSETVLTEGS